MKYFWWSDSGQLYRSIDRWNSEPFYGYVEDLLREAYAEISCSTARALGWPT